MPTEKARVIRDPALGVAVAKCLIHRLAADIGFAQAAHPLTCRICPIPTKDIWPVYMEFVEWTRINDTSVFAADVPSAVVGFQQLPAETQLALVQDAQGYERDPDGTPIRSRVQEASPRLPEGQSEHLGGRTGTANSTGRGVRRD